MTVLRTQQVRRLGRATMLSLSLMALPLAATAAPAKKVYRCGNAFQDQPCADARAPETKPADPAASTRVATACGASDRDAATRGDCASRVARPAAAPSTASTK